MKNPWPVNPGAYLRSAPALLTLAVTPLATYDVRSAAALVVALAGDAGVLLAGDGATGWRARTKTTITWTATLLAAFLLALSQAEGSGGDLRLGGLWLQLDPHDLLVAAALVLKSVLTTALPNALPRYPVVAGEVVSTGARDLTEPVLADDSGLDVVHAGGVTGFLPRLDAGTLAALDAAALPVVASVPEQGPAPAPEQVRRRLLRRPTPETTPEITAEAGAGPALEVDEATGQEVQA